MRAFTVFNGTIPFALQVQNRIPRSKHLKPSLMSDTKLYNAFKVLIGPYFPKKSHLPYNKVKKIRLMQYLL